MPLNDQNTQAATEDAESLNEAAPEPVQTVAETAVKNDDVPTAISIELDFNAYADNVSPTKHAKRVASVTDPSVQDFADQALELAALRAELKRLTRDCESLERTIRSRDARLRTVLDELALTRAKLRDATHAPTSDFARPESITENAALDTTVAIEQAKALPESEAPVSGDAPTEDLSATQKLSVPPATNSAIVEPTPATRESPTEDLMATQKLTVAPATDSTIVEQTPTARESPTSMPASGRQLIPLNHDDAAILLSRDIMTLGRSSTNDVRIASRAVSRDHARLLVSQRTVTIVDMDSANGCFVNDQPVKRHQLRDGDVLRIGDRSYRFKH